MEPLATIQPLQRVTLFETLASELEGWILSGQLEPGSKLPPEGELRKRFGVSRPVVREALARLRERGLIETVNGSGTFVRHPDADHLADAFVRHLRVTTNESGSLAKVYEARTAIETTTARLAAERATRQDLELIETRLDEMRTQQAGLAGWTAADVGFHLAVAGASHNPFLLTLLTPLTKVIEHAITESFRSREAVEAGLRAHEQISERLAARDAAGAEAAMREHLADSERRLLRVRSERKDHAE